MVIESVGAIETREKQLKRALIFDLWETLGTKNVGISKSFFEHFEVPQEKRVSSDYEKAVQLVAWESEGDMARALLLAFGLETTDENTIWTRDLFREGVKKATLYPGTIEFLRKLKTQYKLGLLSNTTIFESAVLDNLGIRNLFDAVSFSWETGYLKPSPESFGAVLHKLGIPAEEVIFIDDGQKNVEAATQLGIQGVRYTGLDALTESLETKEKEPRQFVILLDGSKGAGKTTVGEILAQRLKNTAFLSLDNERRALANQDRPRTERNKEAFDNALTKSTQYLNNGTNLIIDCGLTEERIPRIEALATGTGSKVYKILLKASYEAQLNRVRSRDSAKGNSTDEARFAEVHAIVHAKNFDDFTIIDTNRLNPTEIADEILAILKA